MHKPVGQLRLVNTIEAVILPGCRIAKQVLLVLIAPLFDRGIGQHHATQWIAA